MTTPLGQTYNFSTTVKVLAECCQKATALNIVELNNAYAYDVSSPTHNDPFSQYPAGTTFHVTGPLKLTGDPTSNYPNNSNDKFIMPPGTVLLMDADAGIYLDGGARLETHAATITATCDEMWDGIHVTDTGDMLDMDAVNLNPTYILMRNRIMHSRNGILLEDRGPEFHINATDFLHNYNSLSIVRQNNSYHSSPAVQNKVVGCVFDSDPVLMKYPFYQSGNNYY